MQFWVLATFLGTSLVLFVPGICVWYLLFPEESVFEHCTWGSVLGLGITVYLAFLVAYWRLSFFWALWGLLSLGTVLFAVRQRKRRTSAQSSGISKWALLTLGLVAVSRFAPTLVHEWPLGWDPTFHLILAKKVSLANGMIYDWTPFEDVSLNYPLGSHFLLVVISKPSGLPLHRIFQMLIPLIGVLTTAQVYLLCRRIFLAEQIAVFASVAYGFWAGYGSIDYYRWGGLPNALAMAFLLAILNLLLASGPIWKRCGLMAVFFTSICFTHHHVMVTAGIILAVLVVYLFFSNQKSEATVVLVALAGGFALGAFYLLPYISKAGSLPSTDVFRFSEGPFMPTAILGDLGLVLVFSSALGLLLGWRVRKNFPAIKPLLAICGILVVLFLLCGPIYRFFSLRFAGQDYVAFTPSRFLTDLTCMLSIFAGYAAYSVWKRSRLPFAGALVFSILLGLSNYWLWQELFHEGGPQPESWRAFQWIAANTPADTIVLSSDPWAPFGTWRRTLSSPLPISEPRQSGTTQEILREQLRAGPLPKQALQYELVKVVPPGAARGNVLWTDTNQWSVVEVRAGRPAH